MTGKEIALTGCVRRYFLGKYVCSELRKVGVSMRSLYEELEGRGMESGELAVGSIPEVLSLRPKQQEMSLRAMKE